jgi:hypothetical protein
MKQHWSKKDWNESVPIESHFKTLLADWKRKNQTIGELKAYIDELEFEIKTLNQNAFKIKIS